MYKEGISDVRANAIRGKQYGFPFSSKSFRAVLEYLYTGQILGALMFRPQKVQRTFSL